ncbi:MAG: hypothetical protein ABWY19_05100, partial [Marmoricola sp.]
QTDMVARAHAAGHTRREVPIEFVERVRGDTKNSGSLAAESLKRITRWGLRERSAQLHRGLRRLVRRAGKAPAEQPPSAGR